MTQQTAQVHDNLSDDELVDVIQLYKQESDTADTKYKRAVNTLIARKQQDISSALQQKPEPFGAVSQPIGGMKVTFTTPKKVKWDQKKLADLHAQISSDPDENVEDYITTEFKVSEDAYKAWPAPIKQHFEPARTVEPGSVSVKIEAPKEK
jgi:hypothetical protein